MVRDKVREDISRIERQLSTLSESFITFQTNVLESIQQLVSKLEVSSGQIPVSSSAQTVNVSNVARDGQHPDIRRTSLHHVGIHTESAENDIINDTIRFANQTTSLTVDVLNGAQEIQSSIHTEYQTLRGGAQKSGAEDMNLDHELLFPKPTFSLGLTQAERPHWKETVTEGASMCENDVDHSQSSPDTNLDHELPFPKPTFSLGLTHEECPHPKEAVTEGETMLAKKFANRRISWVPAGKYECDMRLLNRARVTFVDPDNTCGNIDYTAKFSSLDKLKSPFTIRIGQSTLESNDLYELVQRSSPLQPKSDRFSTGVLLLIQRSTARVVQRERLLRAERITERKLFSCSEHEYKLELSDDLSQIQNVGDQITETAEDVFQRSEEAAVSDNDDSVNDSMVRPVSDSAASPIDFPQESYSLSKEAQLEWFNENAFFERKESQKGNCFPAQSTNTNSSSQMISLKSKTSVIRLPKPQKTCFNEVKKRRNCRIAKTLMIPKRFGSLLKSDPSLSEPGSPKVSCIGRRHKSVRTDSLKDKPVMVKKPGFFASVRAIFRTGGGCKSLTASGVHAPYKEAIAPSRRSSDIRGQLPPEEDEKSSPPRMSTGSRKYIDGEEPVLPGLGGMTRFTSGRIPDLLVED
ncbi:unnamed protein product [Brassica napus]|nr:unnamed protein product [Brassica napus]